MKQLIKKIEQFTRDFNGEIKRINDENIVLRKVITEQQNCIERISRTINQDNAFITGIPCTLRVANNTLNTPKVIISNILKYIKPDIGDNDYKIVKVFDAREGQTKHGGFY